MAFYPAIPASDGTSMTPPENAEFQVYELSDTTFASPLPLQSTAGLNAAPLVTTGQGVVPPVNIVSPNFSHIFKSGEWEWRRDSFDAAEAATRQSAADAQDARLAAEEAARNSAAPTQEAVTVALTTEGPAKDAVESVAEAAVTAGTADLALKPDNGRRPIGKGELVINVRDYGAVGDGKTNDTDAFQLALDAARDAGGGTVYAPNPGAGKEYRVGKLYAYGDTTLQAEQGTVLRRWGGTFGVINRPKDGSSPLANNDDPYSGHSNITIDGGIWEGYTPDATNLGNDGYGEGFNCFHWIAARDIVMKNLTVRNIATNHASDVNGIDGFIVDNCKFLGYRDTGAAQTRNYTEAIQYGPFSEDPAGFGNWVEHINGSPSVNMKVTRCEFGPSDRSPSWPAGFGNHSAINTSRGRSTGNCVISDNVFNGCTFVALPIYTYDNVKIDRNDFNACEIGVKVTNYTQSRAWNVATRKWDAAPPRQTSVNHTISNNTFMDSRVSDIQITGVGNPSDATAYALIEHVKIVNNTRLRTITGRSAGQSIRLLLCGTVQVSNNTCGRSTSGISIESCFNAVVSNNTIDDTVGYGIVASDPSRPQAAAWYSTGLSITGNHVNNAGTHGIGANSVKSLTVSGNQITDFARTAGGSGILVTGVDRGLVSGNQIINYTNLQATSGINAVGSTNVNITLDNRIEGTTSKVAGVSGTGTTYGNIQY